VIAAAGRERADPLLDGVREPLDRAVDEVDVGEDLADPAHVFGVEATTLERLDYLDKAIGTLTPEVELAAFALKAEQVTHAERSRRARRSDARHLLNAQYRRVRARRGANRASLAVAHSPAHGRLAHTANRRDVPRPDGNYYYTRRDPQRAT